MKNIVTFFLVITFQFANATEKDSLITRSPQLRFHPFTIQLEEDCDACGCSASGGSMGFASMLNTNFVGIRYFNQSYKSTDGLYSNSVWYNENYHTIQLWARIPVTKNIQISVLVPYHLHDKGTISGQQNIAGIGDLTLLAMYRLYQTHKDSTYFKHTLQAGGGIKIPTGKFDETNNQGSINKSFQLGTGSWDYQLVTEYILKRNKVGLNTTLNYTLKTANDKFYRYGNQFNYSGTFFYLYEKSDFSLAPQLGFAGEVYESNYHHKQLQKNTSGTVLFGKIGVELGKDKFSMGINTMLPINQNLATGNIQANYRWSINLNYSL